MVKMPIEKKQPIKPLSSKDVDRLIAKGSPVKQEIVDDAKKWTCVNLRFPTSLLMQIDDAVEDIVGITRTGWILQTLQKELKRMNSKD